MAFATSTCKSLQTSVTSRPGLVINRLNAKAARGCTTCTCSSHSGFCAKHGRKAERSVTRASTRVSAVATEITTTPNTEKFLHANEEFQSIFKRRDGELPAPPAKKVAVVTCMDARLHTSKFLGLAIGDAHVIRNAGGRVSIDALRSLVISQRMLGTEEVMVIHHTQCGMAGLENEALYKKVEEDIGSHAKEEIDGFDFMPMKGEMEDNIRKDVQVVKDCAAIPDDLPVHGFIYDVATGAINQIV